MERLLQLRKGRYLARVASGSADMAAALALRGLCFGHGAGSDSDGFDRQCSHILIEDTQSPALVCCFRALPLHAAPDILHSYSAQFYDLSALTRYPGPMLEIGRFCIHPDHPDPDILRIAWGALTQWVDAHGIRLLFGCSSFPGDCAEPHQAAFALLHSKYRAPPKWAPGHKAPELLDFKTGLASSHHAEPKTEAALPPLLRTYLLMGGWVSDHAVYDRALHTMHVFTGVEIDAIPPVRARLLRAVAG